MTRIRYQKIDNNLVTKFYKTPTGEEVRAEIRMDFSSVFLNSNADLIITFQPAKSLSEAKKNVKNFFKSINIQFQDEVRPRIKDNLND